MFRELFCDLPVFFSVAPSPSPPDDAGPQCDLTHELRPWGHQKGQVKVSCYKVIVIGAFLWSEKVNSAGSFLIAVKGIMKEARKTVLFHLLIIIIMAGMAVA